MVYVETDTLPAGDTSTWTFYAVIADTDDATIMKVQIVIPELWEAIRATKGKPTADLVEKYGLRAVRTHHV